MTVQGYVQKYFGWNAEDYADFVLTLRLQPNDLVAYDLSAESQRTLVVGWIAAKPTGFGRSNRTLILYND